MNDPKKILIFSTAYYPFVGGVEVAVKEITDRIPDTRLNDSFGQVQFDLITAKMKRGLPFREKIGNVTVYRLGVGIPLIDKLILPFEGALFVRHLEKIGRYDAYWCIMATFASGAAYIKNIFSSKKIPIILTLQEGDSEVHFKYRWFGLIDLSWRLALKRTSRLTVLSTYLAERAKKLGYHEEVDIVPNGVDVKNFQFPISNFQEKKEITLITTSRLVEKNGIGDVIKALPKLPENIKFVILGEGELKSNLIKLAKKLKVSERVIWKGFVSPDEVLKYLKACDIFIRPSLSEGFGNSFIEAMAAGLPVIATPVGGIPDFLEDGVTGYFCQPENPESIAQVVSRVLEDSNQKTVVENALAMVKERYDWSKISSQMKAIFAKVAV